MTLADICEPVFQYVCRVNRMGRKGGRADGAVVRAELKQILAETKAKAEQTPGMAGPYTQVEPVLVFFIDSMVMNSKAPFASAWKPFSHERGELGFEEKFWDLLEDALKDTSENATQRLAVFYNCIGLGFTGLYTGQQDHIRRKMLEISSRIRQWIDADHAARITPTTYEGVDTRNLTQPPGRSLVGLVIAATVLIAAVSVGFIYLFRASASQLTTSLNAIQEKSTSR